MKKALRPLALAVLWLTASPPSAQALVADIDFQPFLNFSSPDTVVTCHIEFPDGPDPASIDLKTVGIIEIGGLSLIEPIRPKQLYWKVGDYDADGVKDLEVRFRRSELAAAIGGPAEVTMRVAGQLSDGTYFGGTDSIRTITFYILQNSAFLGGTLTVALEFSVASDCYVVAKGSVGVVGNFLEDSRPWRVEAALGAGVYRWTLDVPVPADAVPGSEVKALLKLRTLDALGGFPISKKVETKYKVALSYQP